MSNERKEIFEKYIHEDTVENGGYTLLVKQRKLITPMGEIKLTKIQTQMMLYFILNIDTILSKGELYDVIFDLGARSFSNILPCHVAFLRRKNIPIETVRTTGYILQTV